MRIHTGNAPASTVQQQLQRPHWMKNPLQQNPTSVDGIALNTTVGRSACRYTRIAHLYPHGHQQLGLRPSNFRLTQHNSSGGADQQRLALAITADEGIVYVSEPELLSKTTINWLILKVSWDVGVAEGSTSSADVTTSCLIRVELIDDTTKRSSTDAVQCHENLLCAGFHNEHDCHEAQGSVATDQRGCSWRSHGHRLDNSSSVTSSVNSLSRQYQTCSPDLSTCPDGYCDDLESQSWEICPQDCTGKTINLSLISRLLFK